MTRTSLHAEATAAAIGEHVPFNAREVAEAPAAPGVYLLYRGERPIFIGLAAAGTTIRQRLEQHLRGEGAGGTRNATEFDYETSAYARALYRHYLSVYLEASGGRLPECNPVDDR